MQKYILSKQNKLLNLIYDCKISILITFAKN
jgi:hypothetical protein